MKYLFLLLFAGLIQVENVYAQFEEYFLDKTLRFDYYHCGDNQTEEFYFDELKSEPYWAGSKVSLIDDTGYGVQLFKIIDLASGKEIYSRSFNTLFNEWQATEEAAGVRKAMPESVIFPCPKNAVRLEIYSRNKKGQFEKKFEQKIDPQSLYIRPFMPRYETFEVMYNGSTDNRVDLVLVPEGYAADEKERFVEDCRNFVREFFSFEPYKSKVSSFNVRAVWAPSENSGTIPNDGGFSRLARYCCPCALRIYLCPFQYPEIWGWRYL